MPKKAVKTIALLAAALCLTGCFDALDIEDRDICTAVVVDKEEDGYSFTVEVAAISSKIQNPQSEKGAGQGQNTNIVKGMGKTFVEARHNLDRELNKPVYLGAVQAVVITENMSKSDIEEYTFRIRQMQEYRKTMDVLVTPDKPEEFLKIQPENAQTVGFAIEYTLDNLIELGTTFHMSLADLLQKLVSKNPSYLMSTVAVQNSQIALVGYAVFDGGKQVGYIPYEQARGIIYLADIESTPKFDYLLPIKDVNISASAALVKREIKAYYDNGRILFALNLSFDTIILHPSSKIPVTKKMVEEAKEKQKELLMQDILMTLGFSRNYFGLDYLSFSEAFRIAYPDEFEGMDWKKEFKNAEFSVNIDLDVKEDVSVDYDPKNEG
jgi:spore germination protein KC